MGWKAAEWGWKGIKSAKGGILEVQIATFLSSQFCAEAKPTFLSSQICSEAKPHVDLLLS